MKHRDTQVIRIVAAIGLSCLMVFALGLDMSVEIPLKLTATIRDGLWGWLNNMIIALNHFHTMDHLAGLMALVACIWLYTRFLMRGKAPKGEWLLSGFFALIMLISEAAAAENTVTCLWSGGTQIIKSILYLVGMWPLFLTLLRLLHSAIEWLAKPAPLRDHTLWARRRWG